MLTGFSLKDFKSFREATLELSPLTVLIGANASGKSNLVEALRLFSWVARGDKLESIRYVLRGGDSPIRGAVRDLYRGGKSVLRLSCRTTHRDWDGYEIEIARTGEGGLRVAGEALTGSARQAPLFEIVGRDEENGSVRAACNNFAPGGKKPQVSCNDGEAVLAQLQSPARFAHGHKKSQETIPKICRQYQVRASNILFLDPRPSAMRTYSFKTDRALGSSGENLSGVLYNLCRTPDDKERLLDIVKTLPEQDIRSIGFVETPRGEVMVELTETFGERNAKYDATLLSDGALRVLAVAAAVLSAPEGGMVVIEEIDNGVHPSRAERLLNRLLSIAKERRLNILIGSHNPALLDALPDEAVPNVVVCYRDPKSGWSRLIRLADIEDYPALIAQGPVGHSMTRGIVDRLAKTRRGPEERKRRALAWLDELREQVG